MLSTVARRSRATWLSLIEPAGAFVEEACLSVKIKGAKSFSSAAIHQPALLRTSAIPHSRHTLPLNRQQVRSYSWAFWKSKPPPPVPTEATEPPALDFEAVDSIATLANPQNLDAATWTMIHAETTMPNTYLAEQILAATHSTGLSWIVAIPATVFVMRTLMAPFLIMAQVNGHKMAKAAPLLQDAQKQMMTSLEKGIPVKDAQADYVRTTQGIMAENKMTSGLMFVPILVQLPVFTGYYFALQTMCKNHLPSMVVDAAPYGFDLTIADPYHLLNCSVTVTILLAGYLSMSQRWAALSPQYQQGAKYFILIAPFPMTLLFWQFPSALCYYWTCSNIYTIFLELLLRHPQIRSTVGLPSIKEQIELALENQRRQAAGGSLGGLFEMYQKGAEASNKQPAVLAAAAETKTPAAEEPPPAPAPPVPSSSALSRAAKRRNR